VTIQKGEIWRSHADPFDDAATSFLDDLGEPDEAAAFEASVAGR